VVVASAATVVDHLVTTIVEVEATHEAVIATAAIGTAAEMAIVVATVAEIVVEIDVTVTALMATAAEARAMAVADVVMIAIATAMLVGTPVAAVVVATAIVSQQATMADLHLLALPTRNAARASFLADQASALTRKHITSSLT
jgi:hypothetical protein